MTTAEKTTEPRILLAGASLPADLSVHRIDLARSAAQLLQVSEAQLRAASFLDDRLVQPDMLVQWVPLQSLVDAGFKAGPGATLHCIFHAGHAGSTLMSRVLDGVDGVLGLREPQVLRQLAETLDTLHSPESFVSPASFGALVEAQANLWARGFKGTQCVVLKATSHAVRLGPVLLGVRPTTRSISLSLKPEVHITGLLAGPTSLQDLRSQAPERFRRLRAMGIDVQTPLYRLPPGQLAALSWLTEAASQSALSQVAAGRNLPVDFDDFLRDVPAGLHRVLGHFGLPDDDATIETLCDSDAFRRYSKAQDVAYTGETRAGQLADSFKRHGADIAAGMKLLERIGSMNPHAAQLMGAAGLPSGPGALPA